MNFKMICLDADGVIFKGSNFWMDLHKAYGTYEEGKALTEKYLHTDYNTLVQHVVYGLWKGRDAKPYYRLVGKREYVSGVKEFFAFINRKKWITAIVSGGSLDVIKRAQRDFRIDYVFANELIIQDNKVVGYTQGVAIGMHRKAEIITELCKKTHISLKEVVYIGDSSYDIEAFKVVGKSIAFNSDSEELKKHAHIVVDSNNLKNVIPYLEKL
jgi:phosphoserine phosphatase